MRSPCLLAAVAGSSMAPALLPGDRVVVWRPGTPRRGSLVVAAHPANAQLLIVKRLAGGPGESVYGAALRDDEYWLASDNLLAAPDDSRSFGPVASGALVGRVVMRYWPLIRSRRNGAASASESNR